MVKQKITSYLNIGSQKIAYYNNKNTSLFREIYLHILNRLGISKRRTFLVIHGAMGNSRTTDDFSVQLADLHPNDLVYQIDLPAHGKSKGVAIDSSEQPGEVVDSIDGLANYIIHFIKEMQESKIFTNNLTLVGHSMGGAVSMKVALSNKVNIDKLVLLSTAPEFSSMAALKDVPADALPGIFEQMMVQDFSINTTIEQQNYLIPQISEMGASGAASAGDIKALISYDIRKEINKIKIPTFIVHGDLDETATFQNQMLMHNSIEDSIFYPIKGGTHTTVIKNAKEIANELKNKGF